MNRSQLKKIREGARMSQAELASRSGVSVQYVAKLEQTGAIPGVEISAQLARALGVDPDQLFIRWKLPSGDRIGELAELYGDELVDLDEEDRKKIFLYVLSMDASAWRSVSRGKMAWPTLQACAKKFDEHLKKFPTKQ